MHRLITLLTLAVALAMGSLLGSVNAGAAAQPPSGVFVGRVAGSHAFVAVVVSHGKARAYLCDSRRLGAWFPLTPIRSRKVVLHRDRLRVTASISRAAAQGTVTLADGTRHAFHARLAPERGAAGLYRAAKTVHATKYVAGWILLNRSAQRGGMLSRRAPCGRGGPGVICPPPPPPPPAPRLDPGQTSVQITEGSVATVVKLSA